MNDRYAEIKSELEITRQELMARVSQSTNYEVSSELFYDTKLSEKEKIVMNHIREDLRDVERALTKLDYGAYGICEETGVQIPVEKLKILPTARTIYDFSFSDLFDRDMPVNHQENNLYFLGQK